MTTKLRNKIELHNRMHMTNHDLDAWNIREVAIRAFLDGDTETLRKCAAILAHRTAQRDRQAGLSHPAHNNAATGLLEGKAGNVEAAEQDALKEHDYERLDDLHEGQR